METSRGVHGYFLLFCSHAACMPHNVHASAYRWSLSAYGLRSSRAITPFNLHQLQLSKHPGMAMMMLAL